MPIPPAAVQVFGFRCGPLEFAFVGGYGDAVGYVLPRTPRMPNRGFPSTSCIVVHIRFWEICPGVHELLSHKRR